MIFFGPLLLPRLIRSYQTLRAGSREPRRPTRPLPAPTFRALLVLAAVALVFALKTLPVLSPENVFRVTQSRLQTPTDVLFTRLSALRPGNGLTPRDEALRERLASLEARLLYLKFGPAVSADCPFCRS
ncbi:MAG: hypothetical protein OK454_10375, partial [Thaumarchaeota archaeon]|nr:hypothetical protein [Nitrososphaerota archaeon]